MDFLITNLKYLRKRLGITQEQMAQALNLKKSTYASYENDGGNTPTARTLYAIARRFDVSVESLFEINFSSLRHHDTLHIGEREIYFPVSVDLSGTELIDVVPATYKAQAGYLSEFSNPSYIQSLPKINWDLGIYEPGTKRIFQIAGDSMLPIPPQSYILCVRKYYHEIVPGHPYIIVTDQDILFKRLTKEDQHILLTSDNTLYPPQRLPADHISQYWKALKVISDIPAQPLTSLQDVQQLLQNTQAKIDRVLAKMDAPEASDS